ncbi:hypothetical protein Q4Q35_01040 [Flavivirga aquimarina]|uniref:Uncharacterized protein n=1 Tax=Flavivirga aquimarina TaxID=2027862 RepID=A0ABT8W5K2_9FLAO|nr:hypothetical protein [Flavivirga aquimarina]MDO5968381.1 hypothetical protein [Flavivirga aquimarina]
MIQSILTHKKTHKSHFIFEDREFEMENPIKQYGNRIIVKQMILNRGSKEKVGEKVLTDTDSDIFKNARTHWLKLKKEFQKIKVPENLMLLLKTDKKEDQIKLLNWCFLPLEILTSFIFKAYHDFGFTLSQYISGVSKKNFKAVAKIIDYGEHWHCFLTTFNGFKQHKQLHYLSNAFGIDRAELVKQIKSGESLFKLGNLPHVTL